LAASKPVTLWVSAALVPVERLKTSTNRSAEIIYTYEYRFNFKLLKIGTRIYTKAQRKLATDPHGQLKLSSKLKAQGSKKIRW
jgi:hypothetical protein